MQTFQLPNFFYIKFLFLKDKPKVNLSCLSTSYRVKAAIMQ